MLKLDVFCLFFLQFPFLLLVPFSSVLFCSLKTQFWYFRRITVNEEFVGLLPRLWEAKNTQQPPLPQHHFPSHPPSCSQNCYSQFSVAQAKNYLLLHFLTPIKYCIIPQSYQFSILNGKQLLLMGNKSFMPMTLLYFFHLCLFITTAA